MAFNLLSPSGIEAVITGPDYSAITEARKRQLASKMTAASNELAQVLPVLLSDAANTTERNFIRALLGDAPASQIGSGITGDYTFRKDITVLTGGAVVALDGIPTFGLAPRVMVGCVIGGHEKHYQLRPSDGTGFNDGPYTVQAGDTTVVAPVDSTTLVWVETD